MSEHTKLPWRVGNENEWGDIRGSNDEHVVCFGHDYDDYGGIDNPADAAYIVQCVNSHDKLVEALKDLLSCSPCQNGCAPNDMTCASNKARAALATVQP